MALADRVRALAARVAASARLVRVREERIAAYAASLGAVAPYPEPAVALDGASLEDRASLHLCLDAVNFGSGWFPTLRKRDGMSGTLTIWHGVRDTFAAEGAWTPEDLRAMTPERIARAAGQDPGHELMALYAAHLRELGERAGDGLLALARRRGLAELLATWPGFADPFAKRAQITAYDMVCAGLAAPGDEGDLTIFADNLVPHVLRMDGVLEYDASLLARIERGDLLRHGEPAETEIRACAVHAVELMVAARPGLTAPGIDALLWHRGQDPRYKAVPRHRCRTTAY